MPHLTRTTTSARAADDGTWTPRRDVVVEEAEVAPGRFVAAVGPFQDYERVVTEDDGQVTEVLEYKLAAGFPGGMVPLAWLHRSALRRPARTRAPWWAPNQVLDARAAGTLGALATIALVAGYLGTILTQTVTFAADEFDASKTAQSTTLAIVRVGALATMLITALADRRGRRRLLLLSSSLGCGACALGALAPNLVGVTMSQLVVRMLVAACTVLLTVIVAEEMPAGARAYGVTILGLSGALGVGVCLIALPLADLGEPAWRILFVLPLAGLPAIRWAGRLLPESRRFEVPHTDLAMRGHSRRLALLAGAALLLALFKDPASQLLNEFLRDERGFSASRISLFNIFTNLPGLIGVIVGGRLADSHGRRGVGAVALIGGTALLVAQMLSSGWEMWVLSIVGSIVAAAAIPALGVYGPELFPTSLRGRANGVITALGVVGTVTGLVVAGVLSDRWDGLGPALVPLSVGPLLVGVLVFVAYPETARHELEELNPEDPVLPPGVNPVPPPSP
ncbi:MAG TPA: MFS transporter [Acidimicrobiales bacterium]|nr:MFS transporter [Acidimicrobiales bacterium]